jgi:hypothetical protein
MAKKKKAENAAPVDAVQPPALPALNDPKLAHIIAPLRQFAVRADSLVHDPTNARVHGERNLQAICDSLKRFGQDQPLVVQRQGMIVRKGNGRLEAARAMGWEYVAAVVVEESDWEAVARALADNRSAELAQWDTTVLGTLFENLKQRGVKHTDLGWQPEEIDMISFGAGGAEGDSVVRDASPPDSFPEVDENIRTDHECPKCGYRYSGGI